MPDSTFQIVTPLGNSTVHFLGPNADANRADFMSMWNDPNAQKEFRQPLEKSAPTLFSDIYVGSSLADLQALPSYTTPIDRDDLGKRIIDSGQPFYGREIGDNVYGIVGTRQPSTLEQPGKSYPARRAKSGGR